MRILSRLERFDIRRLLSGMIVTVGLIVLLVLCFGIPCRNAFCSSPVKVSGIVANPSEVVKTKMNHSSEYEEGTRNNDSSRENVVAISNVKVELNASLIPSPNVSLGKPEMAVDSSVLVRSNDDSRESNVLPIMRRHKQVAATVSISQMNSLLIQSLPSSHSPKPRWSSARDSEMLSAKSEIENASVVHESLGLDASIYRNISKFLRSYDLMERKLRVYVYKEGKKPVFHKPMPRGIYASEGWFMKLMESNKKFLVKDPRKAHLFYIPVSIKALRTSLGQDFQTPKSLADHLKEYVDLIAAKYKFWNRTAGADHFLVACHDWGNKLTKKHMSNSVRALCNSNVAQGFRIGIDTALPVTYIRSAESPIEYRGGKTPSERKILAFFAGSMHGYLRPILVQLWENKSPDMKILGPMPRDPQGKKQYREYMKSSRYCICARGYEVHTPRVVEAIVNECVPVIIADNYVPPFFEVLNWEEFAVFVEEKDIQNLRNILVSIPEERYIDMQARVKTVQQHFLWHKKPENADDAAKAVESLNGKMFDDKEWYVGRAQKKSERETELRVRREESLREAAERFQSSNLYVKNLDSSVSDETLKEMFSPFGTVTSCKVMCDPNGINKGSGFVAFSTPEEATEAMSQMSGKMVEGKPLYVAIAQRKEDRRVRLQAQFSQVRPVAMPPSAGPRMPMFPPGIGQQMFYGQAPPNMIPPQPGYGYQQQLVPGMRPGGRGPVPNYFMPMVQQQQRIGGGGRRPGGIQQSQHQVPMMQQHQMHPRGRMLRYSQGRGSGGDVAPYDMGNNNNITMPIGALASNLANASPEQQRTMLGENLYPLVEQLEAESAAKVTGMLLEMDQTEVLHLLESPEALKDKVAEAMDVLRSVAAGGAAEQLASLNLS